MQDFDDNNIIYIQKVKSRIERILNGSKKSFDKQSDLLKYIKYLSHVNITIQLLKRTHIGYSLKLLLQFGGKIESAVCDLVRYWLNCLNMCSSESLNLFGFSIRDNEFYPSNDHSNPSNSFSEKLSQSVNPDKTRPNMPYPHAVNSLNILQYTCTTSDDITHKSSSKELHLMPSLPDITFPEDIPESSNSLVAIKKKTLARVPHPPDSLNQFISSNSKTKLYSGTIRMLFTLYELCIRKLESNIQIITEFYFVDFSILRPLFERISPHELKRIEEFNPHYIPMTDNIWKKNCHKLFKQSQVMSLNSGESWKNVYDILLLEKEEKLKNISSKISAKFSREKPLSMMKSLPEIVRPRKYKSRTNKIYPIVRENDCKLHAPLMRKTIQEFKERRLFAKSKPLK